MSKKETLNFNSKEVTGLLKRALAEDIGAGDITSRLAGLAGARAKAVYIIKENGIVCGLPLVRRLCLLVNRNLTVKMLKKDGRRARAGEKLAIIRGDAASILAVERVSLNFLQRLSGIATLARKFADAVTPYRAEIYDTRKTTPGLRALEKYAVRTGGGRNHRFNLSGQVLIKDNHIALSREKSLCCLVSSIKRKTKLPVEVEVTNLAQFAEALRAKPDIIMLDNMDVDKMAKAVETIRKAGGKIPLEASGGVTLKAVKAVARTGVDRVSVGALTHSAPALDISLEIAPD